MHYSFITITMSHSGSNVKKILNSLVTYIVLKSHFFQGLKNFEDTVYDQLIGRYPQHAISPHSAARFNLALENARKEIGIIPYLIHIPLFFKEANLKVEVTVNQWIEWNKENLRILQVSER